MKITIEKDERAFDIAAAWRIVTQMLKKPEAVIGLSTGQTTGGMHAVVSELYEKYPFDVSRVTIFNVDELTNLDRSYSGSCYSMIYEQLFKNLGIPDENFIMPPTMSDDFERECRLFEDALASRGGVDLQMLGIGFNGHVGINQPGTPFESTTWVSPMDPIFEARVRKETGVGPEHPLGGLTLGIKNIMHTRHLILVAKGKHKADIIEQALFGPVNSDMPASIVQLHPNCEVLLDADAASAIIHRL
ncbi:6-phosphogluconolactonase [Paenibacillus sp. MMO-58]|uniref:6-phosphogluconolactonase n=1 Tax=Paenibacillus sp. MMO-58 TaxID=3081290 RepID=UPI00301AC3CD